MRSSPSRRRLRFPTRVRRLQVESLEDRRVLAAMRDATVRTPYSPFAVSPQDHRDGALLVQFRAEANAAEVAASVAGTELAGSWAVVPGLREVSLQPGTDFQAALEAYRSNPDVLFVEPDYRVTLNRVPDDARYGGLWGLNNTGQSGGTPDADIDAPEAWDMTTGSSSVIVAVIDTGVDYTHPDLAANMWTNSAERFGAAGVDDDGNGYIDDIHGYDFANRDGDPTDDFFHGTHVAGTIGAVGSNGIGVTGVAWNVRIMALKFLDSSGGGYTSDAIEALNYAVANGAKISNNSWGGGEYSAAFQTALQNAAAQGHIFVAAAGNNSYNNDNAPFYPASYEVDNVVAVAASDHNDQFAGFTNLGEHSVDLAAPGENILSTFPTYTTAAMADGGYSRNYETISGTSMAAPHVAGVMALVRGLHPEWSADQVIAQVLNTVDVVPDLSQTIAGGRLNAARAVGNAPPDDTAPRIVSSDPAGGLTGPVAQLRLRFSEPIDAGSFTLGDIGSFVGPAGAIAVTSIVPVPGTSRQFDLLFDSQAAEGDYTLVVGPDILDQSGNPMAAAYTARFSIIDTLVIPSTDVPAPIYDWTAVGSYLTVDQNVSIGDLNVRLDVTHTNVGNLLIYLISPSGNSTYLSFFNGEGGQDFQGTVFDDEADSFLSGGAPPYAGSYQPDTPLATFDGESAQGMWQLWIEDWSFFHQGSLNSWSIEITPSGSAPPGDPDDPDNPGDPDDPPPPPPGNSPPVTGNDDTYGTEDVPLTVPASLLLDNDYAANGGSLTIVAVGGAFGGSVVLNANDTITFTPDPNFNINYDGYAYYEYTVEDAGGNRAVGYVNVELTPVNDAPSPADDASSTTGGVPVVFQTWELLANDFDVDGDGLEITTVSGATGGSVVLNRSQGTVTFSPTPGYLGQAGFNYTVSDGQLTATAHVTIAIREVYYFSTAEAGTLTSSDGSTLSFTDADIIQLSILGAGDYRYSMYFDGSDVGLTTANEDIDAFTILSDGTLLVSTLGNYTVTNSAATLTGGGNNFLLFYPYSLGTTTSGEWFTYFEGAFYGLAGAAENIDAIAELSDHSLIISTTGNFSVTGVSGVDSDLVRFDYSTGWSMYLDGSDVGLATTDEDIDGLYIRENPAGGQPRIFLSTRGNVDVTGVSAANEDVLQFAPTRLGGTTVGSYSLPFDGSLYGLANFDLDGVYIGQSPYSEPISGSAAGAASLSASSLVAESDLPAASEVDASEPAASEDSLDLTSLLSLPHEALVPRPPKGPATAEPPPVLEAPPEADLAAVDLVLTEWTCHAADSLIDPELAATPADDGLELLLEALVAAQTNDQQSPV